MKLREKKTDGTCYYCERIFEEFPEVMVVDYANWRGCGKWVHYFKYKGYKSAELPGNLQEKEIINFMEAVKSYEEQDGEYKKMEEAFDKGTPSGIKPGSIEYFLSQLMVLSENNN